MRLVTVSKPCLRSKATRFNSANVVGLGGVVWSTELESVDIKDWQGWLVFNGVPHHCFETASRVHIASQPQISPRIVHQSEGGFILGEVVL
jgi:hypothetical protein